MPSASEITAQHISRVQALLGEMTTELTLRGLYHDASKFSEVEAGPLQEMQDLIEREGPAPYGSEEHKRRTALLGPMLDHHYANNSHHPEHYLHGVAGMNLMDVVEMLCDWKAASERGGESVINLTYSAEKYGIEPMLLSILKRTCQHKGWDYV